MTVADVLLLVFAGMVAVATLVYAVLTWRLVAETRRMREVQTEPRISVRAELSEQGGHGGIDLVIRNEGQGPAQNVRFRFKGDPTYFFQDRPVDQFPVIKNGLAYLGPGQTFRFLLGFLMGPSFTHATEAPWTFHTQYENTLGEQRQDTYVVDFSVFESLIVSGRVPLHDIATHLEALQRDVHHLTTGFDQLRVITQTKQEVEEEQKRWLSERAANAENDLPR